MDNQQIRNRDLHLQKMAGRVGYRAGVRDRDEKWPDDSDHVEVNYGQLGGEHQHSNSCCCQSDKKGVTLRVLFILVLVLGSALIGYSVSKLVQKRARASNDPVQLQRSSDEVRQFLLDKIAAQPYEENLRAYTEKVHLTTTSANIALGEKLKTQLEAAGLEVQIATYNVLLSFPVWENPSGVYLLDASGNVVYNSTSVDLEASLHPEEHQTFSAYSPNGTVQGELVFANYGEPADFAALTEAGVSCKGRIVLIKYGRLKRGFKVVNAARAGAVGVLLYADPADVTGKSRGQDKQYPESWWLPGWAPQEGTLLPDEPGDPLTPGLPSARGIYRLSESEAALPMIPTMPISWDDAHELLKNIGGPSGGSAFTGGFDDITYNMGPGYEPPRQSWTVKMEVNTEREQRSINNIIGWLRGAEEPDRYVIVGCHYDAWTWGAVDPNSGTTVVTALAQAFGELTESGWHPRRTLVFVHFDGEEQGVIGSTEWVEEHLGELSERTVAFINLDGAIRGSWSLDIQGNALLEPLMAETSKRFRAPVGQERKKRAGRTGDEHNAGQSTMYDMWRERTTRKALLKPVSGGSDHKPFAMQLGVATMWARYLNNGTDARVVSYPAYHSAIDTFEYMQTFVDPGFKTHALFAQYIGDVMLQLSSEPKLPLSAISLATWVKGVYDGLLTTFDPDLLRASPWLDELALAVGNLTLSAAEFHDRFEELSEDSVLEVRQYNDRLLRLLQAFLYAPGLPNRPNIKMLLTGAESGSAGVTFAGIYDAYERYKAASKQPAALYDSETNTQPPTSAPDSDSEPHEDTVCGRSAANQWVEVEKQFSVVIVAVRAAATILHKDILLQL